MALESPWLAEKNILIPNKENKNLIEIEGSFDSQQLLFEKDHLDFYKREEEFWNPYKEDENVYVLPLELPPGDVSRVGIRVISGKLHVWYEQISHRAREGKQSFLQIFSLPVDVEIQGISLQQMSHILQIILPRAVDRVQESS